MKFYNYESGVTLITTAQSCVLFRYVQLLITFAPTQATPMLAGKFVRLSTLSSEAKC